MMYAQTNIQLLNQVRQNGYSHEDLALLAQAYRFSLHLFSGRFRASGKTFFAHLAGTASVLASIGVDGPLVTAGLLHAAYTHGDFGDGLRGITDEKRAQLRAACGDRVEAYVARYASFRWDAQSIPEIAHALDSFSPADRDVVTIRLANELDEYLDLGILYCGGDRQRVIDYTVNTQRVLVEIAERLGWPQLAGELRRVLDEALAIQLPPGVLDASRPDESFVVPSASCRRLMDAVAGRVSARPSQRA